MFRKGKTRFKRYVCSIVIMVFVMTSLGIVSYFQIEHWLHKQQMRYMKVAVQQLDTVLDNAHNAAMSMSSLLGTGCSSKVLQRLREQLAITPNVGNIELANNNVVYCSSLTGRDIQSERRTEKLYLTTQSPPLPGHAFIIYRFVKGNYSVITSTDGYYPKNILDSVSALAPVGLTTEKGWMDNHGGIHNGYEPEQRTIIVRSMKYGYYLSTPLNKMNVFILGSNVTSSMLLLLLVTSILAGIAYYHWSGQARTPGQLLIKALKNNELHPFLQPIVRGRDNKPVGCEVLVRWIQNDEYITPDQFIPYAEKSGLIIPITRTLIDNVTKNFLSDFRPKDIFYVSFNISPQHFDKPDFIDDFKPFFTGMDKNVRLAIEITEREFLSRSEVVASNFKKLKSMGVLILLDDFGTGHSTLEYLHRLEINFIKLDKLFITEAGKNSVCDSIIDNVVDLAERLDLGVIAEGVETPQQANYLSRKGVYAQQGYLYSRPLPVQEFKEYLSSNQI